jgi:hypothetical protein
LANKWLAASPQTWQTIAAPLPKLKYTGGSACKSMAQLKTNYSAIKAGA